MKSTFKLKIVTPEKTVFEADVGIATFPGKTGRLGIEARHAPIVVVLKAGLLEMTLADDSRREFQISEGTVDFNANVATILVDTCVEKKRE